jgi:protein SCO1/2
MRRLLMIFVLSFLFMCLSACQPQSDTAAKLIATDITGADFPVTLRLTDHTGKVRSMDDFKGKVVALFFGYTNCPDVCPTTMSDLKQTMKLLGEQANDVQVLFVTLDPARDTEEVLAQFVPAFDARFIGLRGTEEEIAATAAVFKIFSNKVKSEGASGYTIDHSAGMYVFDKTGKIRLYVEYGEKPEDLANDLKTLL